MARTEWSPADRIQLLLQRMERQHIAVNHAPNFFLHRLLGATLQDALEAYFHQQAPGP